MARNNIYRPTTVPKERHPKNTYLPSPGWCPGRKKRLEFILVTSSLMCWGGGIVVMALGLSGSGGTIIILIVALSLVLIVVGIGLFSMYLRMQGHCNLPCWPTRAAQFSQSLVAINPGPGAQTATTTRSGTQMTLAEDSEERFILMEAESNDAERIMESKPKIVFKH